MHRGVRIDGPTVQRLRLLKGWSQKVLSTTAGIAERTVRNAEKGSVLEAYIATYLATALDVPLNEIVTERPEEGRGIRLKGMIRRIASNYLSVIVDSDLKPLLAMVHPSVQWNCFAAPTNAYTGSFQGHTCLSKHLEQIGRWWEQFTPCRQDFSICRIDVEGDMVYFMMNGKFRSDFGESVTVWQTFVCRIEEELILSIDQYVGMVTDNPSGFTGQANEAIALRS